MVDKKDLNQKLAGVELYLKGIPPSNEQETALNTVRGIIRKLNESGSALEELVENFRNPLLNQAMNSLQEAISLTDAQGVIAYANDKMIRLLGVSSENELTGKKLFGDYPFEARDQKQTLLEDAITTDQQKKSSWVKYNGEKGDIKYFNIKITPLPDKSGAQIGLIDLTREVEEATTDGLTGAYSQNYYVRELRGMAFEQANRSKNKYLGVIGIDLKGLKRVNDEVSHKAGDTMIKRIAEILKNSVRQSDYVVRDGGDEFVILCPSANEEAIKSIKGRIIEKISAYNSTVTNYKLRIEIYMASLADNNPKTYFRLLDDIAKLINEQKRESM